MAGVKPRIKLAECQTPDGGSMALYEHDGTFSINLNGQELMLSRSCTSEILLGKLGMETLGRDLPGRILIGGLGLGFTLKSVLEIANKDSIVEVVELIAEVIDWNREHLQDLNGRFLDDSRVQVSSTNVIKCIQTAAPGSYDVILLDVDNGPVAMVATGNASLYSKKGLNSVYRALKPNGRAIFWSASSDKDFEGRLKGSNFKVRSVPAKVHEQAKRAAYLLYVADRT